MKPVSRNEVLDLGAYEQIRDRFRARVIELKNARRAAFGPNMTILFENHDTVRYQIQEMIRVERIVKPAEIAREVATYNELIPQERELSASLLIEYEEPEERQLRLQQLLGLENHVWLVVGNLPPVQARFDTHQISTDRISSVQYVKFALTEEQAARFAGGAKIVIDHPEYRAQRALTAAELAELSQDL